MLAVTESPVGILSKDAGMRRRLCGALLFVLCAGLLLQGCRTERKSTTPIVLTVTDDLGRRVSLSAPAANIISLAPSVTETLFAVGAGSEIAGVTNFCNYPPAALTKPRVGGIIDPNIEVIACLQPDLIIMSVEGNRKEDFKRFEALHVPVFVTNPRSIDGIFKSIRDLGTLTGRGHTADSLVAGLLKQRAHIDSLVRHAGRPTALILISIHPLMAVTDRTFLGQLAREAGLDNIAADLPGNYPIISREEILRRGPEIIIGMTDTAPTLQALASAFPEWKGLRAVRSKSVYRIDPDLLTRPSARVIVALDTLAHIVRGSAALN